MSAAWLLARRELVRHPLRSLLTASGVACGVALVVAIEAINATTLAAFTEAIDDLAGTAALQVRGIASFDEGLADRIREIPGVDHAVPIVTETFFAVDPPAAGEALAVFAADVSDGHAIRTLHLVRAGDHVVDDPLSFLVDPASIVVTDTFAARVDARIGTTLRLRTPGGIRPFTVRGILPPGGVGRTYGGNLLLMDVIGAQTVLDRGRRIDQVDVTLDPGIDPDAVATRIAAILPRGLEVLPPARRGEQIERYLRSYRALLAGVSALALLAASFVVASTLTTTIAARRRELGLVRCIGGSARHVRRLILGEALLAGTVGTALGLPLGVLLARLLLDGVQESTALVFSLQRFATGLDVSATTVALGIVAGLASSLAASVGPARDAGRTAPLVAVREPSAVMGRRGPDPRAIALTAAVALIAVAIEIGWESAWSGNVAALAVDAALILAFIRIAPPLARDVVAPLAGRLGIAGRLAAERLARLPRSLALAAGVLALGLGLMIMAGTLAHSFEASVLDFIRHQVRADVVVSSTATTGWIESPLPGSLATSLATLPGVTRVERLRLAEHHVRGERVSIDSLDVTAFGPDRVDDFVFHAGVPADALAAVAAERAVLVSRNFARQFRVTVGDRLTLDTATGPLDLPVAGVVVDYVSPRGSVIVARPLYVRHWRDDTANRFHVWLAPGTSIAELRTAVAGGVGATHGLKVLTQRELYAYHRDAVQRAFRFTRALEALPLLVAGLGLAEALLAVLLDRRRELACLRAGGATRAQVVASVIAESIGVGALGYLGGLAMGLVLSGLWVRLNFTVQLGWELDFHFAFASLPVAALAALVVTVPAAFLPARRVVSLPIVDALRDE